MLGAFVFRLERKMTSAPEWNDKWWVSHWNYCDDLLKELAFASPITIHDQTLRDGYQFSGIEFSADERVEIAARLGEIGVPRIEASRVSANRDDLDVIKRIVSLQTPAYVMGFVEMSAELVKYAADCGMSGVILCFPSNDHAIREKMGQTVESVIDVAVEMATTANALGLKTVLFPTDASRATPAVYKKMISDIAAASEFDSLTFVDTIGGCSPRSIPCIMKFLRTITDKPLEFHFHNDFGLATANAVAALTYGASAVHTTVLGIGERAGNASTEEVVMILRAMYSRDLGFKTALFYELSNYVSKAAGFPIAENKPIVGNKIFEVECLENLASYIKVPENIAARYTFPYHWDVVGHPPMEPTLGAESTVEVLEHMFALLGIPVLGHQAMEHILEDMRQAAAREKRSFRKEDLRRFIAKYEP